MGGIDSRLPDIGMAGEGLITRAVGIALLGSGEWGVMWHVGSPPSLCVRVCFFFGSVFCLLFTCLHACLFPVFCFRACFCHVRLACCACPLLDVPVPPAVVRVLYMFHMSLYALYTILQHAAQHGTLLGVG